MSAEAIDFVASHERSLIIAGLLLCATTGLYIASGPIRNPLEFPKMAESVRSSKEDGPKSLNFALTKVTPFLKKNVRARVKKTEELVLNEFSVDLHWKPVPNAIDYVIEIFGADGELLESDKVKETSHSLPVKKVNDFKFSYRITSEFASAAPVKSERIPVLVKLPEPRLVNPPTGASFTQDKNVLMTWEGTPLAGGYQVQISEDPSFTHPAIDQSVPENLYVAADTSRPGEYYWRIRSHIDPEAAQSPWSQVGHYTIQAKKTELVTDPPSDSAPENAVVGAEPSDDSKVDSERAPAAAWLF